MADGPNVLKTKKTASLGVSGFLKQIGGNFNSKFMKCENTDEPDAIRFKRGEVLERDYEIHSLQMMNLEGVFAPPTIYYIPNFITEAEEKHIIDKVNSAPIPKWTQLSNRRLQNWGGIPHHKGMIAEEIPLWLQINIAKIVKLGIFDDKNKPNHVLINEYLPGQGIMPHFDGPLFYPTVSTISCGSHTFLEMFKPLAKDSPEEHKELLSLILERRSLLVLQDIMYHEFQHSISERTDDIITNDIFNLLNTGNKYNIGDNLQRSTRISLTIRHVPKTTKLKLKFGR